jgi:cell division protein FtsI (penicillin-binding protein 3)
MLADVNNLPADDPLRAPQPAAPVYNQAPVNDPAETEKHARIALKGPVKDKLMDLLPAKVLAAFRANGGSSSMPDASTNLALNTPKIDPAVAARTNGSIVVDSRNRVAVPSFEGAPLRTVIEQAGKLGLRVEPVGSGLARAQSPQAGTMVPAGTEVAVRFSR